MQNSMKKSQRHHRKDRSSLNPLNNQSDSPEQPPDLQQNLNQLLTLLTTFVKQSSEKEPRRGQRQKKGDFEVEARNREVKVAFRTTSEDKSQKDLRQWIAQTTKTVFSSAFNYFSKGEMNFQQAKIFCSQNIFKNIATLDRKHNLTPQQFQLIDKHLSKKVLPYLGQSYPLTETTQINKKLSSMVQEIDNIQNVQNNYFSSSKIVLQYRKEGNYYDVIMKVVNDLLNKLELGGQSGKTNFQEFQKFMSNLFQKTYNFQWMTRSDDSDVFIMEQVLSYTDLLAEQPSSQHFLGSVQGFNSQKPALQKMTSIEGKKGDRKEKRDFQKDNKDFRQRRKEEKRKKEEQQKYKSGVKEYTSFLIGRKVPQNIPLFSDQQINQNKISIKHSTILRILTKWFEQLWKKFQKNYFSNRSESIKEQKGQNIHNIKPEYRGTIDRFMSQEKEKISCYIKTIEKLNYKLESSILRLEDSMAGEDEMDDTERICGKFASKVVKNLHKEVVEYLNKVIHSILYVSKRFHEHIHTSKYSSETEKTSWPYAPSLISFKVGDLMRCKLSSKEPQILRVFSQMLHMNKMKQYQNKFRIVRIKNRLKGSTNDILINVRFNDSILCEIQLAIKSHASNFIKASNAFHHYIYQLQRSQFGPLSQLCSIWMSFDGRAQIYQKLVLNQNKKILPTAKQNCNCKQYMGQIYTDQPFICSQCHQICLHTHFILKHQKCQNCRDFFICAKCRIFKQDFDILKNQLILGKKMQQDSSLSYRKLLRDNCLKLINENWYIFENQPLRYGLSIFIESSKVRFKTFKIVTYNNKKYLIGQKENGDYFQLGDTSDAYFLRDFRDRNILIQIQQQEEILKLDDSSVIREYILPKIAKQQYKKYKETVVLHMKSTDDRDHKLSNKDCVRILMSGQKGQRQRIKSIYASDNKLTSIPFRVQDFPNLSEVVLSRNPIVSLEGLQKFPYLREFVMENDMKDRINIPSILDKFVEFEGLEKLVLSYFNIGQIPSTFKKMKNLKCLQLEHCELTCIEQIGDCSTLERINVSNNQIMNIPLNLKKLKRLQSVILHRNPINLQLLSNYLPQQVDKKWNNLIHLDVSQCGIKQLSAKFGTLSHLQTLKLQGNQLQQICSQVFVNMSKLKHLNLSENRIRVIPDLSKCSNLTRLDISYTRIEELPSFLNRLSIEEFNFAKCPIRKIECIDWLKELLDGQSTILQKYSYWFQKIPSANHTSYDTKYSAQLVDSDNENQVSSSEEEDQHAKIKRQVSFQSNRTERFLQKKVSKEQFFQRSDQGSQMSNVTGDKQGSQASQQHAHFFKGIKKRISINAEGEDGSQSDDEGEEEPLNKQDYDSSQIQFQLEDTKCAQKLTKQTVDSYFSGQEMLVFDFQSKIKASQNITFFQKQINLYHDENHPQIASTFCKMISQQNINHSTINIYAGNFATNLKGHVSKLFKGKVDNQKLIYNDLRKDKIPFAYAITISNFKKMEVRNTELRPIPSLLLNEKLQKLVVYKATFIPDDLSKCRELKWLKITRSNLRILSPAVGHLKKLKKLDLHSNNLVQIDPKILIQLSELRILSLHQNKLRQVHKIFGCIKLQYLNISSNPIEILPQQMKCLVVLKVFQFEDCPISSIQCKKWLVSVVDRQEAIVHSCQICMTKMHYRNNLVSDRVFGVEKVFRNQDTQDQYVPYCEAEQTKYIQFFNYKFNDKELLAMLTEAQFLAFKFFFKTKYEHNKMTFCSQFRAIVDSSHPQTTQKFKKFLAQHHLENTKVILTQTKFTQLPNTQQCSCLFCQQPLKYPFYWLRWEPPKVEEWISWTDKQKFGCRSCIEASDFTDYYRYNRNSILLTQKLAYPKIPSQNMGNNLQPESEEVDNDSSHNFKCEGCGNSEHELGQARYLCLGCKVSHSQTKTADLVNLCEQCLGKAIRTQGKDSRLRKKLRVGGHHSWHPFLRILFNTEGYYHY